MNRSLRRVGGAVVVLILICVAQLTYLQIINAGHLANDPRNTRAALRDINRPRGPILSADGVVLARSVPSKDNTEFKYQREYPEGGLFAQVVGYQSFVFGNTGVESTYNDALVGREADLQLDNLSDLVSGSNGTGTVVLSLRADVQREAAAALGLQRGSVVVLDLTTGEVVAMYSTPTYDPNPLAGHNSLEVQKAYKALNDDPNKPNLSRAFRELYAPGSTFKSVTAAVAIDESVATPAEPVYPTLSQLDLPQTDSVLRNFGGKECGGNLAESLRQSCNTTFGQIGLDLGNKFVGGMRKFGIGVIPPFDVAPGAIASIGPPAGSFDLNQPLFAFAGIGQGDVATTPLQMALAAAGIGNGGVIMKPHVGAEIKNSKGKVIRRIANEPWRTATSATTAQAVNTMMTDVVEQGTGTAAKITGVRVAGKTGTAQADGGPPHAWFIAFAPADAPRYAVSVIVERGGSLGSEATGGRVAAPIAARVLKVALNK
ncbi:MAG: penicillin-binding protein 2 [Actinobacteria bacterium]|nr:penicillin-binding protein 2 [Actinomycetota bacterium]MSV94895.1 penicillin-binding protein 2 [Actinomycetota bacterium]MSW61337.1 penicillin-binding protein 2 [Actinomycetota bacterium]